MNKMKPFFLGTLVSLPFIVLAYSITSPPQCPDSYSQAQVDASDCIVGANIGGKPVFILLAVVIWAASVWLLTWKHEDKSPDKK